MISDEELFIPSALSFLNLSSTQAVVLYAIWEMEPTCDKAIWMTLFCKTGQFKIYYLRSEQSFCTSYEI